MFEDKRIGTYLQCNLLWYYFSLTIWDLKFNCDCEYIILKPKISLKNSLFAGEAARKGFYQYDDKRKASPDPEIKKYVEQSRSMAGGIQDPKVF